MNTPATATGGAPPPRIFGKARLLSLLILGALLALCFVSSWLTRGAMANLAFLRAHNGAANQSLVDLTPWQTAQTLASLAVTAEEAEYARQAEHLADHEVDQAFAAALRTAELQQRRRVLTGEALALSQKVAALQQQMAQDQRLIDQLKGRPATAPATAKGAANAAAGSDALQIAQAQLGLDTDELADVQRDLDRATGNLSSRIQNELSAHETSMRKYDSQQQSGGEIAVVSVNNHRTLASRLKAWFDQRSRYASIRQAMAEAQNDAQKLTAEHNALEAKANASAAAAAGATLANLENRSMQRQVLSIDDDRIQTDQQLATVYSKWGSQVQLQHSIVLHLILQSLEWIVLIILFMILGDALVRRLMTHPALDRRQAETLRTILEVGVQVVGVLLIVLVFFGPPHQTATMFGLATAALTIALQDYLLAFLGWFMLVGRNGIRVGDLVEINGVSGEVIALGVMSTTLLETTSLAERGEPTGRRVFFLNSYAIRGQYFNFSSEGQWMWDEITVSVPAGEDIYAIATTVEAAVREETAESAHQAEEEWKRNVRARGRSHLTAAPVVTLHPSGPVTDLTPSVDLRIRYVTRAATRFEVRELLSRDVIRLLQQKSWLAQPVAG
ncbi:MAG TPA: mechanosensitive ion channel domain-containing protein [Acidobacteriaceae bacterium]|nr:mechanosensitive ion channel domain-containing protein [Acidobacteriaceae bacterium]